MATALERQKLLLQQEIAKLSNVVNSRPAAQAPSHKPSYHPYRGRPGRGSTPYRGSRGGRGAARGRGSKASYSLDLRPKSGSATPSPAPSSSLPPTLSTADKEEGEVSPEKGPGAVGKGGDNGKWVQGRSGNGNMSLMTAQKREEIQDLAKRSRAEKALKRKEEAHSAGQRVVIDGVVFQFEQGGAKLTRIGALGSEAAGPSSTNTPTRKRLSYAGKQFRRTSKGNLVSSRSRTAAVDKQCRFFAKTGRCNNALHCPYKHDPSRVSACPKFLSGRCPFSAETCPLSHTPTAHNTPSCQFFQATATCPRRSCPYPHVRVAADAAVCEPFALEGWCGKEAGSCAELHTWECPEWRAKGTCSRAGRCGLRHVLKAEDGRRAQTLADASAAGAVASVPMLVDGEGVASGTFENQADFIDFGPVEPVESDHASGSESASDEDEDEDEDDEDSGDDEDEDDGDSGDGEGGQGEDEGLDDEGEGDEGEGIAKEGVDEGAAELGGSGGDDVDMDMSDDGEPHLTHTDRDASRRDSTPSEADEDEVLGVVL